MSARHSPVPGVWLMTDERLGDALWTALRRLPPGAGVVFRHYELPRPERLALWLRVRRVAHARGLVAVSAGEALPGADGVHRGRGRGLLTWPAHNRRQAVAAKRAGAALVFVSSVYPTRSHPGAPALGPMGAARVAQGFGMTVIALGGMNAERWRKARRLRLDGWAGVDAWLPSRVRSGTESRVVGPS